MTSRYSADQEDLATPHIAEPQVVLDRQVNSLWQLGMFGSFFLSPFDFEPTT